MLPWTNITLLPATAGFYLNIMVECMLYYYLRKQ
jgi:hypothetical protein